MHFEEPPPTPTDEAMVADGVRIALAGVRLSIKNRVILDAVRDARDYDEGRLGKLTVEVLVELAAQSEEAAERLERVEHPPPSAEEGPSHHRHHELLERGPCIRRLVAQRLRQLASDREMVSEVVRTARDSASAELRAEVVRHLTTRYVRDAEYDSDRRRRTGRVLRDLRKLERQHRQR